MGYMASRHWLTGDFNGDGLDDLVHIYGNDGKARAMVHLSTGMGFEAQSSFTPFNDNFTASGRWLIGDFEGNGMDDLVHIFADEDGYAYARVHLSTIAGFEDESSVTPFNIGLMESRRWLTGDFNRDGMDDLVHVYDKAREARAITHLSTGSGFEAQSSFTVFGVKVTKSDSWLTGDFNGDQRDDVIKIHGVSAILSAEPNALKQEILFQRDDIVDGIKYDTFRIPAIVKAPNGDLLAFAEARRDSPCDTGKIDIVMKRSRNGGSSWDEPAEKIQDNCEDVAGNPVPIVGLNGRIFLITTRNLAKDTVHEIIEDTSKGTRTAWIQYSDFNGYGKWSIPREITAQVKPPNARWYASGPGHGIRLRRGPNAGRLIFPGVFNEGEGGAKGVLLTYSDDNGESWHMGATYTGGDYYAPSESMAVEIDQSWWEPNIYINSRNNGAFFRGIGYSSDGGVMATEPGSQDKQLIDPKVQGSVLRYSESKGAGLYNRILCANPADRERRKFTIRSSFDETFTWNRGKLINRGPSGYSDMVKISDSYGGVLYENGTNDYWERITFAVTVHSPPLGAVLCYF